MMPTISPYKASASAKIRIRIIPTNNLGCCAFALSNPHPNKNSTTQSSNQTISKCETHNESKKMKLGSQLLIPPPNVAISL
jgi:hypothetical protein